ncbi:MAG: SAM-dependent methyltransferase [Candidatus Hodgkinia cicadicola]
MFILGVGPGAICYVSLGALSVLEACEVALVESLVNRSLLTLLACKCKLKYVGRPLNSVYNNFYGILLSLLWIVSKRTCLAWIKNGEALVYNRGWSISVFLNSFNINCVIASGISAAFAALSVAHVSATTKTEGNIVLSLNTHCNKLPTFGTLVVYMVRTSALTTIDLFICNGLASNKFAMLVCGVSLAAQTSICLSLCSFLFCLVGLSLNLPSLLLVGDSIQYYVNLNWVKLSNGVNSVFN